jgi:hypothetical protein
MKAINITFWSGTLAGRRLEGGLLKLQPPKLPFLGFLVLPTFLGYPESETAVTWQVLWFVAGATERNLRAAPQEALCFPGALVTTQEEALLQGLQDALCSLPPNTLKAGKTHYPFCWV